MWNPGLQSEIPEGPKSEAREKKSVGKPFSYFNNVCCYRGENKKNQNSKKSPTFQGNKLQSHKYFGEWVKRININEKGTQKVNPRDNDNSGKKSTRARQMAQSCNTHRKMIYLIQEDNVWMK